MAAAKARFVEPLMLAAVHCGDISNGFDDRRVRLNWVTHRIENGEWGNNCVNKVNASKAAFSVRYRKERHQGPTDDAVNVSQVSDNERKGQTRE